MDAEPSDRMEGKLASFGLKLEHERNKVESVTVFLRYLFRLHIIH